MGGIGSGARRSKTVGNVEDTLALDVRVLRRLGAMRHGECIITPVCWPKCALRAPSGRLRIDLSEPEDGGTMTVSATMPGLDVEQRISIALVPAPLGGHRCYFICPVRGDRCEVLYYLNGRFACRRAQRLAYKVQSIGELSRTKRKANKLKARLTGAMGFARRRGSKRIEAVEKLRRAEGEALCQLTARLSALARN
jgi:hypothetical protein